tara:strand:+ start:555 stop:773 length:219 start_codon:yes stop_codon:yes gene_type:complete
MDKIISDVVFKYEDNIEISWNGSATFNVFMNGKAVNCFTEYDIKNIDQAQQTADEWLAMELEEEKLRYADAY